MGGRFERDDSKSDLWLRCLRALSLIAHGAGRLLSVTFTSEPITATRPKRWGGCNGDWLLLQSTHNFCHDHRRGTAMGSTIWQQGAVVALVLILP